MRHGILVAISVYSLFYLFFAFRLILFFRKEANMCFYFAKPTVVNPVKDVVRYECMDWCSFLEAITMIVR